MSFKSSILDTYLRLFSMSLRLLSRDSRNEVLRRLGDQADNEQVVETKHGTIRFLCPDRLTRWRAETLLTKEPETLEWIDSFSRQDVLWDIGANIGCYSLYAAMRGVEVLAFEPAAQNFALLNSNIAQNRLTDNIRAYCLALSDKPSFSDLNMTTLEPGGALSVFGQNANQVTAGEMTRQVIFQQGMFGTSADSLVQDWGLASPTHIKIDVDGIEDKILTGAEQTLNTPTLQSVLVEMDDDDDAYTDKVDALMRNAGLLLQSKRHSEMFEGGALSSIYNFIYRKA